MTIRPPIDERTRRERAIRDARTTGELEGARSTEVTRAGQDTYVRGEIDINELGAQARVPYNLV